MAPNRTKRMTTLRVKQQQQTLKTHVSTPFPHIQLREAEAVLRAAGYDVASLGGKVNAEVWSVNETESSP